MLDFNHIMLRNSISNDNLFNFIIYHTTNPIYASIASIIAAAAVGGGTYITDASHPVAYLASWQFLKTGNPRCVLPASKYIEFIITLW